MKKQSTGFLALLSNESVMNLTTEVNEILASGYKKSYGPVLSTADLWNIQRRRKPRLQRRYI